MDCNNINDAPKPNSLEKIKAISLSAASIDQMSPYSRSARSWNVRTSYLARNTRNPIREIIEDLKLKPNPDKSYIPLSIGDATLFGNLKPPKEILDAVRENLNLKESRSYGPIVGHYKARKAVAEYSKHQGHVTADDVILCSGCSHAADLVTATLAEAGQNILLPRPGYSVQKTSGEGLGILMKYYDLLPNDKWKVDLQSLESQIDDDTVAIVVINPSNPCGSVYSAEHLKEILAIASRNKVPIIADEIYEYFVFTDEVFTPISSLSKDVPILTCSGLTKKFLVPGWRMGWIIIHDRNNVLGKEVRKALSNMSSRILGSSALIQQALPDILNCSSAYFDDMMLFIENQAKLVCCQLAKAPGLRPIMPQGAMYMMIEIKMSMFPTFKNELQFIKEMFAEQSVLCLPGQCFNYSGFMRIVLTVPEEVLKDACARIITFCNEHISYAKIENYSYVSKFN